MKKKYLALTLILIGLVLFGCTSNNENNETVDASEIKMRVQDGYIQYYTGSKWENLLSTEELKGEKGDKGDKGDPGTNGKNGINGKNGVDGTNGTNGKDGADGKDTNVQDNITKQLHITIYDNELNPDSTKDYGYIAIIGKNNVELRNEDYLDDNNSKYESFDLYMNENGSVEVEAKAEENWKFVKWSDGVTNQKRTISYGCDWQLVAYFEPERTFLSVPTVMIYGTNYGTNNFVIDWIGDENAKNYSVTFADETFTCDTNSLTINNTKLNDSNEYEITIVANPKDVDNYAPTSYQETIEYSSSLITKIVPEYVDGETTLDDYKIALKNAGFVFEGDKINTRILNDTDGATTENNGKIKSVYPAPKNRIKSNARTIVYVYEYNEEQS